MKESFIYYSQETIDQINIFLNHKFNSQPNKNSDDIATTSKQNSSNHINQKNKQTENNIYVTKPIHKIKANKFKQEINMILNNITPNNKTETIQSLYQVLHSTNYSDVCLKYMNDNIINNATTYLLQNVALSEIYYSLLLHESLPLTSQNFLIQESINNIQMLINNFFTVNHSDIPKNQYILLSKFITNLLLLGYKLPNSLFHSFIQPLYQINQTTLINFIEQLNTNSSLSNDGQELLIEFIASNLELIYTELMGNVTEYYSYYNEELLIIENLRTIWESSKYEKKLKMKFRLYQLRDVYLQYSV